MSVIPTETPPTRRRTLGAFSAAVIALPLALTPVAATAAPADPAPVPVPRGAISAITSGSYLPDYAAEFAAQVDDAAVFAHVQHLAVGIGPRVAGTSAELRANTYVHDTLARYGFTTEIEKFPVSESLFANATPSRDAGPQVSWQYRPAPNARFTGSDAPVTAEVADLGDGTDVDPAAIAGKFVLIDWIANASARGAKLTELAEAGAAGVIVAQTVANSSLANVGSVPAQATGIQVVGAADGQAKRIRELLAGGPLTLSLTTEKSSLESTNTVGVRPAQGPNAENAPIVYIGAHIDSVVGSPGASDNGSGVGILLESARIMSQYPLNTEIRVGTWGAEEKGILGSKTHATQLSPEEIDRTIGAWNMDMAGTSHLGTDDQPFEFWGLTVNQDNEDNAVLEQAGAVSNITGRGDLNRGYVGRSDHQSFHDVGIDAAVFSWMYWSATSSIVLEPTYHKPSDTIDNISQERIGIAAELIGGSAFRAALNTVSVTVTGADSDPEAGVPVAMSCGEDDGWREVGRTNEAGAVEALVPATECDFVALAADGARGAVLDQQIAGAASVRIGLAQDTEAPRIEFAATDGENAAGWYRGGPVEVSLAAADAGDTAPTVEFSVNGGEWQPYSEPIQVSAEGETELAVRATDASGNTAEETRAIRIDSGVPTLTATPGTSARGEVSVAAADETSGVALVEFRVLPAGEWRDAPLPAQLRRAAAPQPLQTTVVVPLGDAAGAAEFRATDLAGNVSEPVTVEFAAVKPGDPKPPAKPTDPEPKPGTVPGTNPNGGLAATGGSTLLPIGLAAGVLLLGAGGAILGARRRAVASE